MATGLAYAPADGTSLAYWTFKSPPNSSSWQPDLSIGNTADATSAPPRTAPSWDAREEPGIVTAVRALLGTVPANTAQGFLAWIPSVESRFDTFTTVTSDPTGGDDTLVSANRWVELTYDDSTDLICSLGSAYGMGTGGLLLRSATVAAHWTFVGGDSGIAGSAGWVRNTTP